MPGALWANSPHHVDADARAVNSRNQRVYRHAVGASTKQLDHRIVGRIANGNGRAGRASACGLRAPTARPRSFTLACYTRVGILA